METMYDKLGSLLRECLETGDFPKNTQKQNHSKQEDFSPEERKKIIPPELKKEFSLLGLYSCLNGEETNCFSESLPPLREIHKAYAMKLKEIHPDTATKTKPKHEIAVQIQELTEAFEKIKEHYKALTN